MKLKFEDVLRHYKVEVRRKGSQHQGPCPLPKHDGNRASHSFSANLDRGIFQCFGCKAGGNVLDFAALMEGADPKDGDALRAVAVGLQQRFFPRELGARSGAVPSQGTSEEKSLPVVVNAPLDFKLQGLDGCHRYLAGRGFTPDTMRHFGVGYCLRGFLKDRVAIPLHDIEGRLVGYVGRAVTDEEVTDANPRYLFPSPRRERGGTIYEFRRDLILYNAHRIKAPCDDLVVVQGFPAVWWLHESRYLNAVALMGSECSEEQTDTIVSLVGQAGRVWLVTDGNDAGDGLARLLVPRLARRRSVRWARLDADKQVTDLTEQDIRACLTS